MIIDIPPTVVCRSGDHLPGRDAFDGALRTFEYYSMSSGSMENLARLALIFKQGFNPAIMAKFFSSQVHHDLERNKFILDRSVIISRKALSFRGIVAANMVGATEDQGDFDIMLHEPFRSVDVLPELFAVSKNAPKSKEIYGVNYT